MPRYFFHVRDDQEYLDAEGTELDDFAAAQRHSLEIAAQLLGAPSSEFWNGEDWHLKVEDEPARSCFAYPSRRS